MLSREQRTEIESFVAQNKQLPTTPGAVEEALKIGERFIESMVASNTGGVNEPVLLGEIVDLVDRLIFLKAELGKRHQKEQRRVIKLTGTENFELNSLNAAAIRYRKLLSQKNLLPKMRVAFESALERTEGRIRAIIAGRMGLRESIRKEKDLRRDIMLTTARLGNAKDEAQRTGEQEELARLKSELEKLRGK